MPVLSGDLILRQLREQEATRTLPVIVISAYKLDSNDEELRPAVILEKPFHVAELLDLVGLFCGLGTPMSPARAR